MEVGLPGAPLQVPQEEGQRQAGAPTSAAPGIWTHACAGCSVVRAALTALPLACPRGPDQPPWAVGVGREPCGAVPTIGCGSATQVWPPPPPRLPVPLSYAHCCGVAAALCVAPGEEALPLGSTEFLCMGQFWPQWLVVLAPLPLPRACPPLGTPPCHLSGGVLLHHSSPWQELPPALGQRQEPRQSRGALRQPIRHYRPV